MSNAIDDIESGKLVIGGRALSSKKKDEGGHYRYEYKHKLTNDDVSNGYVIIKLDPFKIAEIYKMSCFALMTILKKCLCAGDRGHKDMRQDLGDIICAANRKLEMLDDNP